MWFSQTMFCLLNRFGSASVRQCHPTLSKANVRSLSIKRKSKYKKLADPSVHKLVYTFDYIRIPAAFLRSRLYLPISSTIVGSCMSYYLNSLELVAPMIVSNIVHITFVAIAAKFMNNVVGAVYVNKEGELNEVIFCSIDKWGWRIDRKHKLDDIVVCDGSRMITTAGFFVVAILNSDIRYKINFKNCKIHDLEASKILFDDHEFLKSSKK